jgi:hypothetical protein
VTLGARGAQASGTQPEIGTSNTAIVGFTMNTSIVALDGPVESQVVELDTDRLISGTPVTRVDNYFTDRTQQFFAGRWSATRGKWRVRYTENELCVMTAGRVVIESEAGERRTFGPGDAFVMPAGFAGTWEVLEDCSKIYAIFEAATLVAGAK